MICLLLSAILCASAQTTFFSESFGIGGYYDGPANACDGMDNPGSMFTADLIIVQNYNPSDYDVAISGVMLISLSHLIWKQHR